MYINEYRLLHSLGAGSYGKVKLAENMETGTLYAIKMIKRVAQEQARKRLRGPQPQGHASGKEEPAASGGREVGGTNDLDDVAREIAIMKKLRHANVRSRGGDGAGCPAAAHPPAGGRRERALTGAVALRRPAPDGCRSWRCTR